MKKMKVLFGAGLALTAVATLASCRSKKDDNVYNVGILQFVTHEALGKATEGFKQALIDKCPEGKEVKFNIENPETDSATMLTMANKLVRKNDLVLGNATPAATQLVASAATEGKKKLPILFTSVTDPVGAQLVSALSGSGHKENVTGTSDINPIKEQADLIFDFDSTVKKIGFLYNVGEQNSKAQCDQFEAYVKEHYTGVTLVTQTVSEQSQIASAAQSLSTSCDAIYLPTDNLIASNIPTITNVTNQAKVPLFCGESGMVSNGGTMTFSIKYYDLGYTTGEQAAQILFDGKKASEIDVQSITDPSKMEFTYSKDAMTTMNLTFTDAFKTKYSIK